MNNEGIMRITSITSSLLLGGAVVLGASPAMAETPAFSWTGPYVGVSIGRDAGNSTWTSTGAFGGADRDTLTHDHTAIGGQTGYNYQIGRHFLIGLEASLHGTDQSAGHGYTGGEGYSGATAIGVSNKTAGDVSARAGVVAGHVLFFGKVGYGFAHYNYTATLQTSEDGGTTDYAGSTTRSGVLFGGGLEFGVTRHVSIVGEYDHASYGTKTITLTGTDNSTFAPAIGQTADNFKVGINYRF